MMVKIMEETEKVDLQEFFQILKKRLVLIVALAFVATMISGFFTHFFMTPIYQTSTQLALVPGVTADMPLTHGEINANIQMINTLNEVIVSPMILAEVIEYLDLDLTVGGLRSMMSAANRSNTLIITLTVQNERPELARDIANVTAEIFYEEVVAHFNMNNVRILAPAQVPRNPVSPRLMMNLGLAFIIGTASGVLLAFLLEFLDKTVNTEQEVEKLINIPVLGMIPMIEAEDIKLKN